MPLQSIAFAPKSRTSDFDAEITPAELPSGRVRFSDELGRETALAAREPAASAAKRDEKPVAKIAGSAKTPPGDDDEVALALAALGLAAPPAPPDELAPQLPTLEGVREIALAETVGAIDGASAAAKATATPLADASLLAAPAAGRGALLEVASAASPFTLDATFGSDATVKAAERELAGELLRATAKPPRDDAGSPATALDPFHALLAGRVVAHDATKAPPVEAKAPAAAANAADVAPPADALPRVALADVPRALPALLERLEPELRFGRRGRTWEVELRLDPPELGSLRFRLELRGDEIRGVVHCEPRVERLLGPVLKDLEENLRQHGGGAAFDLQREAKGEERPWAPREDGGAIPRAAAEPRAPSRRAADPSRLVDVTA